MGTVSPWFRLAARRLLAREARAYRALNGVAGIPRLLGSSPEHLVLSFIEGTQLPQLPPSAPSEALFDALDRLVASMHARGVACGDLHHRNVLVDAAGAPHLVDFALAISSGRGWLFRRLAELDRNAALRMRLRYLRREPTAEEAVRLQAGGRWWRAGRALKRLVGALSPRDRHSLPHDREHTP